LGVWRNSVIINRTQVIRQYLLVKKHQQRRKYPTSATTQTKIIIQSSELTDYLAAFTENLYHYTSAADTFDKN
jgi:hypothetical protein